MLSLQALHFTSIFSCAHLSNIVWSFNVRLFPFLFVSAVGCLGFELCVFVVGWSHALRSEWPFYLFVLGNVDYTP